MAAQADLCWPVPCFLDLIGPVSPGHSCRPKHVVPTETKSPTGGECWGETPSIRRSRTPSRPPPKCKSDRPIRPTMKFGPTWQDERKPTNKKGQSGKRNETLGGRSPSTGLRSESAPSEIQAPQSILQSRRLTRPPRAAVPHTKRLARRSRSSPPHPRRDRHTPTPRRIAPTTTPIKTQVLDSVNGSDQWVASAISNTRAPTSSTTMVQNTGQVARSGRGERLETFISGMGTQADWSHSSTARVSENSASGGCSKSRCTQSPLPSITGRYRRRYQSGRSAMSVRASTAVSTSSVLL